MYQITKKKKHRRHWFKLFKRIIKLSLDHSENSSNLITNNYNKIATEYDISWTHYMQNLSEEMLDRLPISKNAKALDLTCGTGFVTGKLAKLSEGNVVGVDVSKGMLDVARHNYGNNCKFVNSDLLTFLHNQPSESVDIVTCAWGLGYFRASMVIKEISRILRPGGFVGIIDNSRSSNSKIVRSVFRVYAENPTMLKHIMKVHYLRNSQALSIRMRLSKIRVLIHWDGTKIFYEPDAKKVIERLTKTGAALGGVEFTTDEKHREEFYRRLAEIIQERCEDEKGVPIKYKYLAAIGKKQ